jgi:hypothetical protein
MSICMARIAAMLRAGTHRVRQTLLATNRDGALVAWKVTPEDDNALDWMFSAIVLWTRRLAFDRHGQRRTIALWTTVKMPHGFSLQQHCSCCRKVDAKHFVHAGENFRSALVIRRKPLRLEAKRSAHKMIPVLSILATWNEVC